MADSVLEELRAQVEVISPFMLRSDSRLAAAFVEGHYPERTLVQVAHEQAAIQYLYEHTPYPQIIEARMRTFADHVKARYPQLPWTQVWTIVRNLGPQIVKAEALFAHGGHIHESYRVPQSTP